MTVVDPPRVSEIFTLDRTVVADDIDVLGHMNNLVYVRWVQDAAWDHSTHLGWDHAAYVRVGAVFVVRRQEIDYLASAMLGDVVRVSTWIESWTAVTSLRRTSMERLSDGRPLLKAATTWAMVSATTGRPTRIAREITASFAKPARTSE